MAVWVIWARFDLPDVLLAFERRTIEKVARLFGEDEDVFVNSMWPVVGCRLC